MLWARDSYLFVHACLCVVTIIVIQVARSQTRSRNQKPMSLSKTSFNEHWIICDSQWEPQIVCLVCHAWLYAQAQTCRVKQAGNGHPQCTYTCILHAHHTTTQLPLFTLLPDGHRCSMQGMCSTELCSRVLVNYFHFFQMCGARHYFHNLFMVSSQYINVPTV